MGIRLTKDVVNQLLKEHDGFEAETYYQGRNFRQSTHYLIKDGKLIARHSGKTSWADSRFENATECDIDQTRRFLRKFIL